MAGGLIGVQVLALAWIQSEVIEVYESICFACRLLGALESERGIFELLVDTLLLEVGHQIFIINHLVTK